MDSLNGRYVLESLNHSEFWAIRPDYVAVMLLNILRPVTMEAGLGIPAWEAAKPSVTGPKDNKVAIIPVQGVLTSDGPSWYGTNYNTITDAAEKAAGDPSVKRIVLSVDSPGGQVTGLPETAAVLAQVAKVKPVSAIVEGLSASAAYWLTSQAQDITLTPSGEVGSVGVRMMHVDVSKMLEDAGYRITELSSGQFKTEWSPYKPLSDEAKADMQTRLDNTHKDFLNAVTSGRGSRASAEIQASRFGEGRMFSAADAMGNGLVDKIQAPRDFYRVMVPAAQVEENTGYGLPRRARLEVERERV
jgi:signal peptide peptidase SppA